MIEITIRECWDLRELKAPETPAPEPAPPAREERLSSGLSLLDQLRADGSI